MTDTISKAAKAKAEGLASEIAKLRGKEEPTVSDYLIAFERVLQEHSDIAKFATGYYRACGYTPQSGLQSMILPDDEPDPLEEIGRDLFQRIAHGDSEHREWLKRELTANLRLVAAGYTITRKDDS